MIWRAFKSDPINTLSVSSDGRFVACGGGYTDSPWPISRPGKVKIWDFRTEELLATFNWHWGAVSWVEFSADGNGLASASYDGAIRIWRIPDEN
jgi:WD40 repeat protein